MRTAVLTLLCLLVAGPVSAQRVRSGGLFGELRTYSELAPGGGNATPMFTTPKAGVAHWVLMSACANGNARVVVDTWEAPVPETRRSEDDSCDTYEPLGLVLPPGSTVSCGLENDGNNRCWVTVVVAR